MKDILQQLIVNKDSVYPELNEFFLNFEGEELLNVLNNIDSKKLYKSVFHGLHHSQKVCLFAYLIAKHKNLSDEDLKIVLDASIYHDIGRMNEFEEEFHGFKSASIMQEQWDDEFYKKNNNLTYLRLISESHSFADHKKERIFNNYKYENPDLDYDKFELLDSILKDADALDRTRFKQTAAAALKEQFLRIDFSKSLISFAQLLNNHYAFKMSEIEYNAKKSTYEGLPQDDCFHGVGFNFFSFESILKSGILSKYESIRENISAVRNFNGNNKNIWISVVDAAKLSQDGKAYNEFIKNGISLYCFVPQLVNGEEQNKNSDYNTAVQSNEYTDEKFVFNKIPFENIHSIVINKEIWDKNITELNYLYGSNNYDIISEKVHNYAHEIEVSSKIKVDFTVADALLQQYQNTVLDFESKHVYEQKREVDVFLEQLDALVNQLNHEVQKWINIGYQKILGIEDIKVSDVIKHILVKNNIKINDCYENEEIMIVLNPLDKVFDNNNGKKI